MALRTPLTVSPHMYIGDSTGRPLDYGMIYFGEPDKDPEFYPIDIFSDDGLTVPLSQPVRTKGGYLNNNKGDMAEIHAQELIYSVKVLDQYGRKIFYKGQSMRSNWNDDVIIRINEAVLSAGSIAQAAFDEQAANVAVEAANSVSNAITDAVLSSGFITIDSFELGAIITQRNEALRHTADGKLYRWAGDLPKVVPASSTPTNTGGFDATAWMEVSDTTLRQDVLSGEFVTDALVKTVALTGGFEREQRHKNAEYISVKDFGAIGIDQNVPISQWCTVGSIYYKGYASLAEVIENHPHVESGNESIDWVAIQSAINYVKNSEINSILFPAGTYVVHELSIVDISVNLYAHSRNEVFLVNEGEGCVFKCKKNTGAEKHDLRLTMTNLTFGRGFNKGIHTNLGSHAISIDNYVLSRFTGISIQQSGQSGIYIKDGYVVDITGSYGRNCGMNTNNSNNKTAIIEYERVTWGNSLKISNCYFSNSINTNGVTVNFIQAVTIRDTTFESCRNLIEIGMTGYASRTVNIESCYFENPVVSAGFFSSIYGLSISNCYTNLVGPRGNVNYRVFYFRNCKSVTVDACNLSSPNDTSNPNYKAALEFFTGTSLAYADKFVVKNSTSVSTICLDTGEQRLVNNVYENTAGIVFEDLPKFETAHADILKKPDLLSWSNIGNLNISKDDFYDKGNVYNITGDGTNNVNQSLSIALSTGDSLCLSMFFKGSGRITIRGRKTSDSSFENIALQDFSTGVVGSNESIDLFKRIVLNNICKTDYNLINIIIRPDSNVVVSVAYLQLDKSLNPSHYKINESTNLLTGTTVERPTNVNTGFMYYDTTLNKPIYRGNTTWVDSQGGNV